MALRLQHLQRHLERLYRVNTPHKVEEFLITDPQLLRHLDQDARETDEKLLVMQDDAEHVDLALYLNPQVVERLGSDDPGRRLHEGNLADFCTVLEGVSHFVYLTWNAALDRCVTHLELEMQAEVDKYVLTSLFMGRQRRGRVPRNLHRRLFDGCAFDPALDETERERYRHANRYAGKYCLELERRYLHRHRSPGGPLQGMVSDLRRFYRLGLRDKIRRIDLAL